MIPVGYIAKKISVRTENVKAANVRDISSVSGCISENFDKPISFGQYVRKMNGYWLYNSPQDIRDLAVDNNINLHDNRFFFYEVYEKQYVVNEKAWKDFEPEKSMATNIEIPKVKKLIGYDVVTFAAGTNPECSPLSCNNLAQSITVNEHCLLPTFEEARQYLDNGSFNNSERGPFRIFAIYVLPDDKND